MSDDRRHTNHDPRFLRRGQKPTEPRPSFDAYDPEFAERDAPPWDLATHHESSRQDAVAPLLGNLSPAAAPSRTAREAARGDVLLFRRRSPTARRVRRLRKHPLVRLLQPLLIAAALVGLPAATGLWMLRAPVFAVDEIRLSADSPARRVSEQWVLDRLAGLRGHNLWQLDLEWPAEEMRKHPWVQDIGIRKQPPRALVVQVLEKQEAALYQDPSGLVYVDTDGSPVAPLGPSDERGVLTILTGKVAEPAPGKPAPELRAAIALLQEIKKAGPMWAAGLDQVEILSIRDFRVHTTDLPFPLLVRAGTVGARSRRFEKLLPWISELGLLRAVDLRFVRRIIVEPADPKVGDLEAT